MCKEETQSPQPKRFRRNNSSVYRVKAVTSLSFPQTDRIIRSSDHDKWPWEWHFTCWGCSAVTGPGYVEDNRNFYRPSDSEVERTRRAYVLDEQWIGQTLSLLIPIGPWVMLDPAHFNSMSGFYFWLVICPTLPPLFLLTLQAKPYMV